MTLDQLRHCSEEMTHALGLILFKYGLKFDEDECGMLSSVWLTPGHDCYYIDAIRIVANDAK